MFPAITSAIDTILLLFLSENSVKIMLYNQFWRDIYATAYAYTCCRG
jgi:hypothetical protein